MLVMPSELKEKTNYKLLIYGQPGVGKTTLALSSVNPVLIDFEQGIYRVQKKNQTPSLQVGSFKEVIDFINSEDINCFQTIVFDTLGRLIDCIEEQIKKENKIQKLRIQDWGKLKMYFNDLVRTIYSKNKNIIFVAHEKEEKEEEIKKKRVDTGSGTAGASLINDMDLVGYMSILNKRRTISFTPSEYYYAKNSLNLEDVIEIADTSKQENNFIQEKIIKSSNDKIKKDAELRKRYDDLILLIDNKINILKNVDDVNNFYKELNSYETIWDSYFKAKNQLNEKIKELNISYDKETKKFISK